MYEQRFNQATRSATVFNATIPVSFRMHNRPVADPRRVTPRSLQAEVNIFVWIFSGKFWQISTLSEVGRPHGKSWIRPSGVLFQRIKFEKRKFCSLALIALVIWQNSPKRYDKNGPVFQQKYQKILLNCRRCNNQFIQTTIRQKCVNPVLSIATYLSTRQIQLFTGVYMELNTRTASVEQHREIQAAWRHLQPISAQRLNNVT